MADTTNMFNFVVFGIPILIFPGRVMVLAKLFVVVVLAENFLIAVKAGCVCVLCLACLWRALYCTYLPSCCALPNENYSGRSSRTLISVHEAYLFLQFLDRKDYVLHFLCWSLQCPVFHSCLQVRRMGRFMFGMGKVGWRWLCWMGNIQVL